MTVHVPVLPAEVLQLLAPTPGATLVDGTLGGGGHTRLLAQAVGPTGRVIGLDRDPAAVERTIAQLAGQAEMDGLNIEGIHANYGDLPEVLEQLEIEHVDGILLDLGLSSDQLADDERGFSFDSTGPLDLRFDPTRGEPASRLINRLSAEHLADLIYHYGEEKMSRRIARQIVQQRRDRPIQSAVELASAVRRAVGHRYEKRINPATRTFQALRIAVNDELKWVETALKRLPDCLAPGGRLAIISFHSLEDRLVKQALRSDERMSLLTKKAIKPTEQEIQANPRSRSARLRAAQRLPQD